VNISCARKLKNRVLRGEVGLLVVPIGVVFLWPVEERV
jgi:hypothetical protein